MFKTFQASFLWGQISLKKSKSELSIMVRETEAKLGRVNEQVGKLSAWAQRL